MKKRCHVYWIHLESHSDIKSEGYVGITSLGVSVRFALHRNTPKTRKLRPTIIMHAIAKHGNALKVTTLVEGSQEYCQMIENRLRPTANIGWNIAPGGAGTRLGQKNTPEHIARVVAKTRGVKHTEAAVMANRARGIIQNTFEFPWQHPVANKDVWSCADVIYAHYVSNPRDGRRTVGRILGMPDDSVQKPLFKIKSGWIPAEDKDWLAFRSNYNESKNNVT